MRKKFSLIVLLFFMVSCSPGLKTARSTGRRGTLYPRITEHGVLFRIKAAGATLVTIAGTFNGWNPDFNKLTAGTDGIWAITLPLKPGITYQYKYLVDGHWIPDPSNPVAEEDGFGGYNSLFTVPGKGAVR